MVARTAPLKPRPQEGPAPVPRRVGIYTRMTDADRERINALAAREGITAAQLGRYAFDLALASYGAEGLNRDYDC